MRLPEGQRSTAWLKRLPEIFAGLNNEVTQLTAKKPAVPIKEKDVAAKLLMPCSRPVGQKEKKLPSLVNVQYLFQPGKPEGGQRRATNPIWSLKVFRIERFVTKPNEPVFYYWRNGLNRG